MFGKKDCSNPSCLNEKLHIRHSHGKNTGYLLSQGETGLSTIAKVLPKALLLSSSGLIHFGKVRLKLPLTFIQLPFLCPQPLYECTMSFVKLSFGFTVRSKGTLGENGHE